MEIQIFVDEKQVIKFAWPNVHVGILENYYQSWCTSYEPCLSFDWLYSLTFAEDEDWSAGHINYQGC